MEVVSSLRPKGLENSITFKTAESVHILNKMRFLIMLITLILIKKLICGKSCSSKWNVFADILLIFTNTVGFLITM